MSAADADPTTPTAAERARLRGTLSQTLPEIPPIYFYDDLGSALFEQITAQPEYYHTRTELSILGEIAGPLIADLRPQQIVELGSGAGRKIRLLLDAWVAVAAGGRCTMFDVNELFVAQSVERLQADYPSLEFAGVTGDFSRDLGRLGPGGGRLTVFFGNTLGNFYPAERAAFLAGLAAEMVDSDAILIGVDLIKDQGVLEAAFNDAAGVTAEFNRNALRVLNRRFGADFDVEAFVHRGFYVPARERMEMRLQASRAMVVHIPGLNLTLDLPQGAELRTEVSYRFTRSSVAASAGEAGLEIDRWYTDAAGLFAVAVLRRRAG